MADNFGIELGEYQGRLYHLHIRAVPSQNDPNEWAVVIWFEDPKSGDRMEIVKVDTAHEETHIHRNYRRDGMEEPVDWSFYEAMSELEQNWRSYAEQYEKADAPSDTV